VKSLDWQLMSKEKKLIPELRFPEFKKDGEWVEKAVGQVYEFKITNSYPRELLNYDKGTVKNIHYGDIHTKFNTLFDVKKEKVPFINQEVSIEKIKEDSYCIEGDMVFADASEDLNDVGKSIEITNLDSEKLVSGLHTLLARQRKNILTIGFGGYLFKSDRIRKQIQREAQGAKVLGVSATRISNIRISYPENIQEQQKIASCLSSLDELITAHSQKLELLKDHKKGLMQNLFPKEGEKAPKVRFPEFVKCGEWMEEKLGAVCSHFKGFAFQSKDYTSTGRRIVRVSDMGFEYIKSQTNAVYINEEKAERFEKWKLQEGDLIITTVGSKPPAYDSLVGRTIVVESKDENSLLNQNSVCVRANKKIIQMFLKALFERTDYISFIESIIRGNANQGSIALEDLFKYKFLHPGPQEQQQIASCLSSLDALITAQAEKMEQLKLHKKGLMQGLFPKTIE
jgi:type I restriction enzyme S subunit